MASVGRSRWIARGAGPIEQDAAEWGVDRRMAWGLFLAPVLGSGLIALTIPIRDLFALLVEEDRVVEWLQVGLVLGTAVLGALIGRQLLSRGERGYAALYVIAAIGALFIAGEEISWGQRLLGLATPEQLAEINRQGETNIHNIGDTLRVINVVMMLGALAAGILPFLWRRGDPVRRRGLREIVLVPPAFLASGFLLAFGYRFIRLTVLPEARYVISHLAEVAELALYGSVLVFVLLVHRRLAGQATSAAAEGPTTVVPSGP